MPASYVSCSTFLNFDYVELTWYSEMKRKPRFSFAFHYFFRNFGFAELTVHSEKFK